MIPFVITRSERVNLRENLSPRAGFETASPALHVGPRQKFSLIRFPLPRILSGQLSWLDRVDPGENFSLKLTTQELPDRYFVNKILIIGILFPNIKQYQRTSDEDEFTTVKANEYWNLEFPKNTLDGSEMELAVEYSGNLRVLSTNNRN